jgi:hypothetical protein
VTKTSQNKHLLENDEDGLQFISKMNSTSNKNLYAKKKNLAWNNLFWWKWFGIEYNVFAGGVFGRCEKAAASETLAIFRQRTAGHGKTSDTVWQFDASAFHEQINPQRRHNQRAPD